MNKTSLIRSRQKYKQLTVLIVLLWVGLAAWLAFTPTAFAQNQPAAVSVPIGGVIDWWRPNDTFPLPEGFQICDGSLVTDQASPFVGVRLPDLRNRFVRGAVNLRDIGERGGQESHDHMMDLPAHTHSGSIAPAGSHNHIAFTGFTSHSHIWGNWFAGGKTWKSGDGETIIDYSDGISDAGAGFYPLAPSNPNGSNLYYTGTEASAVGGHNHPVSVNPADDHTHALQVFSHDPPVVASSREDHLPPYVGLLKIMRIK